MKDDKNTKKDLTFGEEALAFLGAGFIAYILVYLVEMLVPIAPIFSFLLFLVVFVNLEKTMKVILKKRKGIDYKETFEGEVYMGNGNSESQNNTLYCSKCSAKMEEDFKFCTTCGSSLLRNEGGQIDRGPTSSPDNNLMVCPRCGSQIPGKSRFCTNCGTMVGTLTDQGTLGCPHCGTEAAPGQQFCTECGLSFDGTGAPTNQDIRRALEIKRVRRND